MSTSTKTTTTYTIPPQHQPAKAAVVGVPYQPSFQYSSVSAPPPGVPAGGVWGRNNYVGEKTGAAAIVGCLCFCLPGLLILLCPFDEQDAYLHNGYVYDAAGRRIGRVENTKFVPSRR